MIPLCTGDRLMRRVLSTCVVLLGAAALLLAADGERTGEAAGALKALDAEYRAAHDAFIKALGSARTDAARTRLFDEWQPKLEAFNARYLELARKHGTDPAAAEALFAVLAHSDGYILKKADARLQVVQLLKENHLLSEAITSGLSLLPKLEEAE